MKKIFYLFVLLCVFLSGCHNDEPHITGARKPQPKSKRTIVVYMAAENRLQYNAQLDLTEMRNAKADIPEGSQVVIFVDDCETPRLYKLTNSGLKTIKQYDEDFICTRAEEMTGVLEDIYTSFPSESYGLILWSHGSGWVPGTKVRHVSDTFSFGTDNGKNSPYIDLGEELSITTLAEVLSHFPKQEFIMFDCCLMQCVEVAYELKDLAQYIIASPAEIPAMGAPYDKLLAHMFEQPFTPDNLIRAYYEDYIGNPFGGVLLSAVVTAELPELARLTSELFTPLCNERTELTTEGIQRYFACCANTDYAPEYFDINGAMKHHLDEMSYQRWYEQFNRTVISRMASRRWLSYLGSKDLVAEVNPLDLYGGLTLFIPNIKYDKKGWNEHFHAFRWYTDAGWANTGW